MARLLLSTTEDNKLWEPSWKLEDNKLWEPSWKLIEEGFMYKNQRDARRPTPSTFHLPPSTFHLPPSTFHLPPSTFHLPPSTSRRCGLLSIPPDARCRTPHAWVCEQVTTPVCAARNKHAPPHSHHSLPHHQLYRTCPHTAPTGARQPPTTLPTLMPACYFSPHSPPPTRPLCSDTHCQF